MWNLEHRLAGEKFHAHAHSNAIHIVRISTVPLQFIHVPGFHHVSRFVSKQSLCAESQFSRPCWLCFSLLFSFLWKGNVHSLDRARFVFVTFIHNFPRWKWWKSSDIGQESTLIFATAHFPIPHGKTSSIVWVFKVPILFLCVHSFFVEPVGFKGPSFSSVATSYGIYGPRGATVALTCEAQAYPVPVFR